ncbi:MAG: Dam family site-specific DNA-(adenine-N6)-methyltransferase [Candidatus Omnitrophica bacterium]|nr:Dam family site-specific DNA-(adenine-N6)-methyltransferase [Candidatus Omnitrophota bacterium]MBU0974949.1 Dam family site-specific DNA-(adenine-N6)-methyltransferase [Patescibacteria group bacterium]
MNSFLKWAGGKKWLIPKIKNQIPKFKTYYEPFLGSGTLFFELEPKSALLADSNFELINCYRQVRNNCLLVIKILKRLKNDKNVYYRVREKFNCEKDLVKKSAYFIYLNKMCWNGLYRVNSRGEFNVPIGKNVIQRNKIFDTDQLLKASQVLKNAELKCCDFEETVKHATRRSDFIYLDPPYVTTNLTNGFIKYNSVLFSSTDELRLSALAHKLACRGVKIMLSNAAHPLIMRQYKGMFYKTIIDRASLIAGDPTKRSRFAELLVSTFPMTFNDGKAASLKITAPPNFKKYKSDFNPKCKI